jgi:hypothetical protein
VKWTAWSSAALTRPLPPSPPLLGAVHARLSGYSLPSSSPGPAAAPTAPPLMAAIAEELGSVKALYGRIEEAEKLLRARARLPNSKLDVAAAGRFIKAGLDREVRQQQQQREQAGGGETEEVKEEEEEKEGGGGQHAVVGGGGGASAAAAAADPEASSGVVAGAGHRGHPGGQLQQQSQSGHKRPRGGGGRGGGAPQAGGAASLPESAHRSSPAPPLSHLNWRADMEKQFGPRDAGGGGAASAAPASGQKGRRK